MHLSLVEGPATEPLTADEARTRVATLAGLSDEVVEAFISAARASLDGPSGYLQRAIITQTWDMTLSEFPANGHIEIPLPPLQAIDSVSYVDSAGAASVMDEADYQLILGSPSLLVPAYNITWPTLGDVHNAVVVRFTAGYGYDGSSVPENIKIAIALRAGTMASTMTRDPTISQEQIGAMSWSYSFGTGMNVVADAQINALIGHLRVMTV